MPLATWTQIVLFIVSIAVFAICTVVLKNLDDTDDGKNTGYWPNKPNDFLEWRPPSLVGVSNAFAFSSGGVLTLGSDSGVRFALRPQVEYVGFRANGNTTGTVRLSVGIVFRIWENLDRAIVHQFVRGGLATLPYIVRITKLFVMYSENK